MKVYWHILLGIIIGLVSAHGQNLVVESFNNNGTMVFTELSAATNYTIECAPTPAGPWSECEEATTSIIVTGSGSVTTSISFSSFSAHFYRAVAYIQIPDGMVLIPGGEFLMGDPSNGNGPSLPVHSVNVSGFYMDITEVTKAQWDTVYNWALNNGYSFENAGSGKAPDHPVHTVSWYDAVKWCNARSEMEGRSPCYTVNTNIYRSGQSAPNCDWSALGYRLPTEAEWEKGARGGLTGLRFPWGDTITHSNANYYSYWSGGVPYSSYDLNPTSGFHPAYHYGAQPYTNPAGDFSANEYGLYDMSGNVSEWCWDRYEMMYYSVSPSSNPHGPTTGNTRVRRGGSWGDYAFDCPAMERGYNYPHSTSVARGFRTALPAD